MKKKYVKVAFLSIFIILLFGIMGSCGQNNSDSVVGRTNPQIHIKIVEYDGCEYIYDARRSIAGSGMPTPLTHKGNCKNPIHKNGGMDAK